MKRIMLVAVLLGSALLGLILYRTDLNEVWTRLMDLGGWGIALILLAYLVCVVAEAGSWLLTLRAAPATPRWHYRLWKLLMVGWAFEATTPLAGLGGEPVKAFLLKRYYGIRYRDTAASLVLARTTDLLAQILFIAIGFALMFRLESLPLPYRVAAGSGLALLVLAIGLFILAQRSRGLSRLRAWLERGCLRGRRLGERAPLALDALDDIDDRLLAYYSAERGRFALSVGAALVDWWVGALAVYLAVHLLGHPIRFVDAVVIEAFAVMVRSALFFVPANIGTLEGAMVLICGAITGSTALGLALAALRRLRDLLWILAGLAIGASYSVSRATLLKAAAQLRNSTESVEPAA